MVLNTSALFAKLETSTDYKLLSLTPDLLAAIERNEKLEFKAARAEEAVVLCSKDKTWLVKQKNHSNTVLLMEEFAPEDFSMDFPPSAAPYGQPLSFHLGYSKQNHELEPRLTSGEVDISLLPVFSGNEQKFKEFVSTTKCVKKTVAELRDCSPCSALEFERIWPSYGGCVVQNIACILSRDFISRALHITLMSCMAESLNFERLTLKEVFVAVNKDMGDEGEFNPFSFEVIRTILGKFSESCDNGFFILQRKAVARWYGIDALTKCASRTMIPQEEFMIKWKSLFPPYFSCDLDFNALRGHFYRPLGSNIQYFSKAALPDNPKDRFDYLFKMQSTWDLDDMVPFIQELNSKGVKMDSFVMKYARRKRHGKRTLISAR
ncbi:LADA_0H15896g1_1 [Lachancea dasiensis]|uniref:LADA_0H15896g1_1 n=1 Tax=Lachancea dasiensis TaxID=1072105 RepID=A0A1G4K532_9SACH|nr:LADA_0H15896g1_1 [Lachancea dasiensis]